jgi:hypothetical protein
VPKYVTETGEVVFDTELVRMEVDVNNAKHLFKKALKILDGECLNETCEWCKLVDQ